MKLSPREAKGFFARPDPRRAGVLIHGADPMRVALRRKDLILALIGPEGEGEMRLARLDGPDLRREPAALQDAIKAQGFFPGQRAVLLEETTDGLTDVVGAALDAWAEGDAMLVATAGLLPARSKLRKLFEGHANALSAAIHDDPPGRDEIEEELRRAGLPNISSAAMGELETLARSLDPGDFRQTLEKVALYKLGDPEPLTPDEVLALAPATLEAAMDDLLHAVAEGRQQAIGPLMQRLSGQGATAVGLILGAERHFRTLHAAVTDPEGPAQGLARARPPVIWKHRDRMAQQARNWGRDRLEAAVSLLLDTDLALRSAAQTAPQMALVERTFLRLAMPHRPRGR